jgi:signal transduction histidine kinase
VRAGAVVIAIGTSGLAAIGYLIAWGLLPADSDGDRAGGRPRRRRLGSWRLAFGIALLSLSVLLAFRAAGLWWSDALVWPLVLASFGVALLWGLTRPPRGEAGDEEGPRRGPRGADTSPARSADEGAASGARADPREAALRFSRGGFGIALVLAAALLFLWANGILSAAGDVGLAALVVVVALALISAPLWLGMLQRLRTEREARIRSQERAEVAAHLHDSVLQTLALVQRRSDDPGEVAKLARRQERELRGWLAGEDPARPDERLADALRGAATDVEESHGAIVEAVVVGDAALDPAYSALAAAAREALTNAAKFASEGGPVRLYAEIGDAEATVWVDDRGPGFDPAAVPADRRGVRESIIGRMKRHGGSAEFRSGPDGGTEVELSIERNGR